MIMSAQWKALSKMDIKKFIYIFTQQRNLKRLRTLGQSLGYSLKGLCIGLTGGSLVGYPAAVSGKSMQPVFNEECAPIPSGLAEASEVKKAREALLDMASGITQPRVLLI